MKKTKKQNGITLIALIITIVVLMILAVVTINSVKDGGIIDYAKKSRNEHVIAEEKEKIQLAITEWNLHNKTSTSPENFKAFMTKKLAGSTNVSGTTFGPLDIVYNETGNKYKVYTDKELILVEEKLDLLKDYFLGKIDETTGQRTGKLLSDVIVDMNVKDISEVKFKNDEIINDANRFMSIIGGEYDQQSGNAIYYIDYKEVVYLLTVNLEDFSNMNVSICNNNEEYTLGTISDKNKTINGEEYSSTNPIIPAGFLPKNTTTSKWDAEGGPEADKGLVITDGSSDFVWIPVTTEIKPYNLGTSDYREPDVITGVTPSSTVDSASGKALDGLKKNLDLVGCTDLNNDGNVDAYDFKEQLENEFNLMATSVNKYGGFYVGRYETSVGSNNKAQSVGSIVSSVNEELIIPANAGNESMKSWYGLYALNRTYSTNSVQGTMMWGSQYNAMMTWIGDFADSTIGENRNQTLYTGGKNTDAINNIHDLYGCLFEWTIEAYRNSERTARGGFATIDEKPNAKMTLSPYQQDNWGALVSSRIALYITE